MSYFNIANYSLKLMNNNSLASSRIDNIFKGLNAIKSNIFNPNTKREYVHVHTTYHITLNIKKKLHTLSLL